MSRLRMHKAGPAMLKVKQPAPVQATKRIAGNSLYALMKRFERDNPRVCAQCKREGRVSYGAELDHITPLHLGGSNAPENMQWLCMPCHKVKSEAEAEARASGVHMVGA